jgi:hypothetical protein
VQLAIGADASEILGVSQLQETDDMPFCSQSGSIFLNSSVECGDMRLALGRTVVWSDTEVSWCLGSRELSADDLF